MPIIQLRPASRVAVTLISKPAVIYSKADMIKNSSEKEGIIALGSASHMPRVEIESK